MKPKLVGGSRVDFTNARKMLCSKKYFAVRKCANSLGSSPQESGRFPGVGHLRYGLIIPCGLGCCLLSFTCLAQQLDLLEPEAVNCGLSLRHDFSWKRVSFPSNFPRSWNSAVFCLSYGKNVDNTLMFQLLLSNIYPQSRTSVSHGLPWS